MPEFKPTPNKMICNKAKECTRFCFEKEEHIKSVVCETLCDLEHGIPEAICISIPLTGAELIADERRRQIEVEGWTQEHDTQHIHGELAIAGACYAFDSIESRKLYQVAEDFWPWDMAFYKPTHDDPIRQLVKAGALIAAEIDRLQRIKDNSDVK